VLLFNAQNPLENNRLHKILWYCLKITRPFINQLCLTLKVKSSM
jgi:hypothetical protein